MDFGGTDADDLTKQGDLEENLKRWCYNSDEEGGLPDVAPWTWHYDKEPGTKSYICGWPAAVTAYRTTVMGLAFVLAAAGGTVPCEFLSVLR